MADSTHNRSIDYTTLPSDMVVLPLSYITQMETFRQQTIEELQRLRGLLLTQGSGYISRRDAIRFLDTNHQTFNLIRHELVRCGNRYCIESCRTYLNRHRIDPGEINARLDELLTKK